MFLGGPLYFCKGLRERFVKTLNLSEENAVFPDYARVSVAIGAALYGAKEAKAFTFESLAVALENATTSTTVSGRMEPLFDATRHMSAFSAAMPGAGCRA